MNIENLTMNFGTQLIFDDISVQINENSKVGIVGVNGAGKSTLFNIITNKLEPTSGNIKIKTNSRIAFLPQVVSDEIPNMDISVFDFLLTGRPIKLLEKRLSDLYEKASIEQNQKNMNIILKKISKTQDELEYWDIYNYENILLKIISGMNVDGNMLDMRLCDLSGGQKSKIAFARLLYSKPEIILLDEPTNHLDKESRDYIINYLKNYKGTVLIISHDIDFLDSVTDSTLYLNKLTHKIELFPGNYDKYLKIKKEREKSEINLLEKQEKEEEKLKKIIEKYIRGNEKKANIAKDRQKKLAKLQQNKVVIEQKQKVMGLKIKINTPPGLIPIKVDNITFGYIKEKPIIKDLSFELTKNEKFLIVGENGVGKSTLLKLIINRLIPDKGMIELNPKTEIAYYAQEHELLDPKKTIIDNFSDSGLEIKELRAVLGSFLFHGDDIYKSIAVLSPGERSRVALAKIALTGSNMLILDEPTNHLDPETQKIIADAFKNYTGTMLVVSHNTQFIDNLGIDRILMLPSGLIKYYDKKIVEHYEKINNQ